VSPFLYLSLRSSPEAVSVLYAASPSSCSLAARLALFSSSICRRSLRIEVCLSSTPCIQYPKLAPTPANTGHAHRDPRLKRGRISNPSCHARTATPSRVKSASSFLRWLPEKLPGVNCDEIRTEACPEEDPAHHLDRLVLKQSPEVV